MQKRGVVGVEIQTHKVCHRNEVVTLVVTVPQMHMVLTILDMVREQQRRMQDLQPLRMVAVELEVDSTTLVTISMVVVGTTKDQVGHAAEGEALKKEDWRRREEEGGEEDKWSVVDGVDQTEEVPRGRNILLRIKVIL